MNNWLRKALWAVSLCVAFGNVTNSLAATYYVSIAGNDVNSGTQESPWRSIQHAANRVTAGDTVRVSNGTYNENVTIGADGNSSNWINFVANGNNGPVIVRKISFSGANYVRLIGFEITHVDTAYGQGITFAGACSHIEILDNYIHHTRFEAIQTLAGSLPSYITIRGNRMDYMGHPGILAPAMVAIAGVYVTPHHMLIEYNHVTRMQDFCDMYGTNVIVRNNSAYWVDTALWSTLGHPDMFQPGSDGVAVGTRHHVYERNWTGFTTNSHSHFGIWQDTVNAGDTNQLIRGNVAHNIGGGGIGNIGTDKMSIYNNSFFNMCHVASGAGLYVAYRYATVGGTLANNIIQNDNSGTDAISLDSAQQILNTHNWGYQAGTESSYLGTSDPLFNSLATATLDMRLQSASPVRGRGTNVVRITSASGSGTSFVVNDGQLLCDGFDMVEGDVIVVGSTRTRITDIDWSTHRVTVASPVSWTQNTPVYWGDLGDQRDLGAYPHGARFLTGATIQQSGTTYTVAPVGDARGVWFYVDGIPTIWDCDAPFTATVTSGTVTAKAYALWPQQNPVVVAISGSLPPAPMITSQPGNQMVAAGGTATFTVSATGTGLTYQWQRNGSPIAGATGATLTLNNVTTADQGTYTVVVSNSGGSVTSSPATLTVRTSGPLAVSITSPTNGATFSAPANFTLVANPSSPTNITTVEFYQNGAAVGAVNSSPYTFNVVNLPAGTYTFTARATDNTGTTATSAGVTVTVTTPPPGQVATPTISPTAQNCWPDVTVAISTATSGATIHYTTNGAAPTTSSATYTGPFTLGRGVYTVRALAVANGLLDSNVGSQTYRVNDFVSANTWQTVNIGRRTNILTWRFEAVPNANNIDGLVTLARGGTISTYGDNAVLIRFNGTGTIDARNGADYGALVPYAYTAGVMYEFSVAVNVPAKTYSVDVRSAGEDFTRIATDWAFRTEQNGVSALEQLVWYSDIGSLQLRNVTVGASSAPSPPAGLRIVPAGL